jgi:hypothetical protein
MDVLEVGEACVDERYPACLPEKEALATTCQHCVRSALGARNET